MGAFTLSAYPPAAEPPESSLYRLPAEVQAEIGGHFFDRAKFFAALAGASRRLRDALTDGSGHLRIGCISLPRASVDPLQRVHFARLAEVRIDLFEQSGKLVRQNVEDLITSLGTCLAGGASLRVLAVRLASYEVGMERLRLGKPLWESLVRGLHALGDRGQLRTLELSCMPMKLSVATRPVACDPIKPTAGSLAAASTDGAASTEEQETLTFLKALASLTSLEELKLTQDEILGDTAMELADALCKMPRLRVVDLTRNRISPKAMTHISAALPSKVELLGGATQTCPF